MSNYAAIPHAHIKCQIIQPRLMRIQLPYYAIIPHVFAQCQIKIPIPHSTKLCNHTTYVYNMPYYATTPHTHTKCQIMQSYLIP